MFSFSNFRVFAFSVVYFASFPMFAQENQDIHYREDAMLLRTSGSTQAISISNRMSVRIHPFESVLRIQSVQNELELTIAQRERISDLLRSAQSDKTKLLRLWFQGERRNAAKELAALKIDFENSISEVLLLHQQTLLFEIAARINLRAVGIERFLKGKKYSLTDDESAQVEKVLHEWREKIASSVSKTKQDLIANVLSGISAADRDKLVERFKLDQSTISLLHLTAQLKAVSSAKENERSKSSRIDGCFDVLERFGQYELLGDGTFDLKFPFAGVSDSANAFVLANVLKSNPHLQDSDRLRISSILAQQAEERDESRKKRNLLAKRETLEHVNRIFLSEENDRREHMAEQLGAILKTSNNERIADSLRQDVIRANGVFFELVDGVLADELGLSPEDRGGLRSAMSSAFDSLSQELRRLEVAILRDVNNELREENKREFSKVIKGSPKEFVPSIALLLRPDDPKKRTIPLVW